MSPPIFSTNTTPTLRRRNQKSFRSSRRSILTTAFSLATFVWLVVLAGVVYIFVAVFMKGRWGEKHSAEGKGVGGGEEVHFGSGEGRNMSTHHHEIPTAQAQALARAQNQVQDQYITPSMKLELDRHQHQEPSQNGIPATAIADTVPISTPSSPATEHWGKKVLKNVGEVAEAGVIVGTGKDDRVDLLASLVSRLEQHGNGMRTKYAERLGGVAWEA